MPRTAGRRRPTASDTRPPIGAAIAPSAEIPSSTKPLVWASPPWIRSTRSGTSTSVACRITVAPNTPTTAAGERPRSEEPRVDGRVVGPQLEQDEDRAGRPARQAAPAPPARRSRGRAARAAARRGTPARRPSPGRSIGRGVARRSWRRPPAAVVPRRPTATAAKIATGTATTNNDRQPRPPTSSPPTSGPTAALVDTSMSNSPNADPRRSGGAIARSNATELVETSAPVTAWSTRDSARISNETAVAASADANANARDPERGTPADARTDRRGCRSPAARSRPRRGRASRARRPWPAPTPNSAHDARQGDREHRRVERHEDRAGCEPEHRPGDQAGSGAGASSVTRAGRSRSFRPARASGRRRSAWSRRPSRRPPAGRTRGRRRRRATGRRRCSSRGRRRS